MLDGWLGENGMPPIITVKNIRSRKEQSIETLEQDCLVGNKLPDIAYEKKGCSVEWKKKPCHKWVKENFPSDEIVYTISYNADEKRRMVIGNEFEYPLIDAGWGRVECIKNIVNSGLPIPCKSACFYCPSSSKNEIQALARKYPDLAERAIAMERAASSRNTTTKGLGRNFAWESVITQEQNQSWIIPPLACECIDFGVGIEEYWNQF
jgi:hypothetical protein